MVHLLLFVLLCQHHLRRYVTTTKRQAHLTLILLHQGAQKVDVLELQLGELDALDESLELLHTR